MSPHDDVGLATIREAHDRIRKMINRTPVMTSSVLNAHAGASLFFKCENLQKGGAFKARGAINAVFSLTRAEALKGVVAHSSGNHAAAVALAARLRGIPSYVVIPSNAPKAKQCAVQRYGGNIFFCEPTQEARESTAARVAAETGATLIHAYDDARVIAGQGTVAIELLEDVPELDAILCPVGGGGLLSGIAVAAKSLDPHIRILAVEPEGADDAARSFAVGRIVPSEKAASIADGLLTSMCERTFGYLRRYVDDVIAVPESAIVLSMRRIWEVMKLVVEPSGAVAYAGVGKDQVQLQNRRVGVILSGGNLDLDHLPWQQT
jgi:threonine dehydratase